MSAPAPLPTEVPCPAVMVQAAKLAMEMDRPILLDYFADTYHGRAYVGEEPDTKEKVLVKANNDDYTSLINKTYKVAPDYIVLTENSIYITSGKMTKKTLVKNFFKDSD